MVTRAILWRMQSELMTSILSRSLDEIKKELEITQALMNEYGSIVKPAIYRQYQLLTKQYEKLAHGPVASIQTQTVNNTPALNTAEKHNEKNQRHPKN